MAKKIISLITPIIFLLLFQSALLAVKGSSIKPSSLYRQTSALRPFDNAKSYPIEIEFDDSDQIDEYTLYAQERYKNTKSYKRLFTISLNQIRKALLPGQKRQKYSDYMRHNIHTCFWIQKKIEKRLDCSAMNKELLELLWDNKDHELLKDRIALSNGIDQAVITEQFVIPLNNTQDA